MAFKVIYRDDDECRHDTGVSHSPSLNCERVEREMDDFHMREDDPLHQEMWHDAESCDSATDVGDGVKFHDMGKTFIDPDAE